MDVEEDRGIGQDLKPPFCKLPAPTAPLPQHKKPTKKPGTAKRLKPPEADELITAYQAGMNVYTLGEHFGITWQTVSAVLKRHCVRTQWNRRSTKRIR
ncbi:hypothetical protein [Nocardiopsis algeriensis]|uniref:Uncharacterized protein n=1 Tax=Nocardiopsis algeriensis TaxID=1478215 RepID=A0A841IM38_9ACTN|nr:hypothetical protein [Nocardiopsis algeriensis]MBB6119713.1 hypothetical protein [Nocardiopsis algeriensis]